MKNAHHERLRREASVQLRAPKPLQHVQLLLRLLVCTRPRSWVHVRVSPPGGLDLTGVGDPPFDRG